MGYVETGRIPYLWRRTGSGSLLGPDVRRSLVTTMAGTQTDGAGAMDYEAELRTIAGPRGGKSATSGGHA